MMDVSDDVIEAVLVDEDPPLVVDDQDAAYDIGAVGLAMDPRFSARITEISVERTRRRTSLLLLSLAAVAVVALVSLIARAAVFDVDEVRVSGANRETVDRILDVAAVREGIAIWSVDVGAVERRVERLPWVADATVHRRWPDTITIALREYQATAFVRSDDGSVALLGADGRVLERADAPPPDVVEITGVRRVPEAGGMLFPPGVGALMVGIPDELAARVASIDVTDGVTLRMAPRGRVRLCSADDLAAKGDIALALMRQVEEFTAIDVCVPSAPTVR
jgi:cell division protein FtsQ